MGNTKYISNGILVFVFMALIIRLWDYGCNEIIFDGARCFFIENRWNDIKMVTLNVPKEELDWRFVPIFVSSLIVVMIKKRWLKEIFAIISVIIIIGAQIRFGMLHWNPILESSCFNSIIIHGGAGMIFATTYIIILTCAFNGLYEKKKMIKLVKANIIAYCASVMMHMLSNVSIVLTQSF